MKKKEMPAIWLFKSIVNGDLRIKNREILRKKDMELKAVSINGKYYLS